MKAAEDFYFGLGLVTAAIMALVAWAMTTLLFNNDVDPGIFTGTIVLGLYYIYRGLQRKGNNGSH